MHVTQPILVIFLLLSLVTDEIYAFLPSLNSIHQQSITRFNVARYTDQTSDQDTISAYRRRKVAKSVGVFINLLAIGTLGSQLARAEDDKEIIPATSVDNAAVDFGSFKVPYFHSNIPVSKVLGEKATVVVNMKLDDPQTAFQFPGLTDLYNQYGKRGLNVLIFPTDQGWFEPDDDETCRLKAKEYYQFGDFPHAVVFDKVDLLGPSAHPLYVAMTSALPTPNGYNRITLNYEKFLLDAQGKSHLNDLKILKLINCYRATSKTLSSKILSSRYVARY